MRIVLISTTLSDEIQRMMDSYWWGLSSRESRGMNWLAWDKLCVSKELEGLGFQNIYAFSLTMLGKQEWRFISKPNACQQEHSNPNISLKEILWVLT